jgi:hypothetical protein
MKKTSLVFAILGILIIPSPILFAVGCDIFSGGNNCGAWTVLMMVTVPVGAIFLAIAGVLLILLERKNK